jgi:hypothetical protein
MTFERTALYAAALAAIVSLAACGGGDDTASNNQNPGPTTPANTGSRSGVLTDGPVGGVTFTTSSGITGTTDADGRYTFNPGDTLTFSIGTLTLASGVTASGVVTPVDLASGDNTKLTNLLVLLQSLDTDSGTGITVPANATTAVAGLNLTAPTATFSSSLQSGIASAGLTTSVVTQAQATQHFIDQGMKLLAGNIWVGRDDAGIPMFALQIDAEGNYQFGEHGTADEAGQSGVEAGKATITSVDAGGYKYSAVTTVDTNGEWGLSHPQPTDRLRSIGESLVSESGDKITRMDNVAGSLVGAWQTVGHPDIPAGKKAPLVLFFANGYVAFVDTVGEYGLEPGETSCSNGGLEVGRYSYNATTGALTLSSNELDQNGCAGLWDGGNVLTAWELKLSADGNSLVAKGTDSGGSFEYMLTRVSK